MIRSAPDGRTRKTVITAERTTPPLQRSHGRMKLAVFGLSISSSWGNGHAALWRGLVNALSHDGHRVTFFEHDTPWYAEHRDLHALPDPSRLVLYRSWPDVVAEARRDVTQADAAIVTSYCPDGQNAAALIQDCRPPLTCFYDLDTPVTLARLAAREPIDYLPQDGLSGFDLVFSYTGGEALEILRDRLGARRVLPLYGSVDPAQHSPAPPQPQYQADLSYLGTYAADRQPILERLFVTPARLWPGARFVIGGAMYPPDFPWAPNIYFVRHLPPAEHPAFYSSSRLTLNVTRAAMARMGWCPSGRLFEAAACGVPILSDWWDGLDTFFEPGREILIGETTEDTLAALDGSPEELRRIAARARERVLAQHTAAQRARELIAALETVPAEA
jgi:spore maturation protein CgeB